MHLLEAAEEPNLTRPSCANPYLEIAHDGRVEYRWENSVIYWFKKISMYWFEGSHVLKRYISPDYYCCPTGAVDHFIHLIYSHSRTIYIQESCIQSLRVKYLSAKYLCLMYIVFEPILYIIDRFCLQQATLIQHYYCYWICPTNVVRWKVKCFLWHDEMVDYIFFILFIYLCQHFLFKVYSTLYSMQKKI